jgi:hypothetical protein
METVRTLHILRNLKSQGQVSIKQLPHQARAELCRQLISLNLSLFVHTLQLAPQITLQSLLIHIHSDLPEVHLLANRQQEQLIHQEDQIVL